ncbi:TRAP transporter small permease [Bordetella petrii]|uniref:TRAP transporter small permease n=1 Tax=Bordetella petrii TaxID=94624 RepID=UPI001E572EB2|nr:TRAP transporter small permease [Bordetella petrii]MCD0505653.1 TRAP transporter small permease [Bordetella petrii]
MRQLEHFFRSLSNGFGAIALVFLLFLMFGTTLDAIARGVWGRPLSGVFELAELSMVMVVFLGLGWTKLDNAHIRVTMLVERMPRGAARLAETLSWAGAALFLLILAVPSTQDAAHSFAIREFRWGYIEFPIWWAKIALAAGLWFGFLQLAFHALYVAVRGAPAAAAAPGLRDDGVPSGAGDREAHHG